MSLQIQQINLEVAENETRYITWAASGRLGNMLFQYVTTYSTAKKTNKRLIIVERSYARQFLRYFPNLKVKYVNSSFKKAIKFKRINFPLSSVFDKDLVKKSKQHQNVCLFGNLQSWKYFCDFEDDIKQQLTPDKKYIKRASSQIKMFSNNYTSQFNMTEIIPLNLTYIGIHVRRGDMATQRLVNEGFKTAPDSYIEKAMKYYRSKYQHTVFIVCSNDMEWCKSKLRQPSLKNDIFFSTGNPIEDFALLSSCNHSIITIGTYGWWSAWLAGGHVVYYSLYPVPGSRLSKRMNAADYYPQSWIPMK